LDENLLRIYTELGLAVPHLGQKFKLLMWYKCGLSHT